MDTWRAKGVRMMHEAKSVWIRNTVRAIMFAGVFIWACLQSKTSIAFGITVCIMMAVGAFTNGYNAFRRLEEYKRLKYQLETKKGYYYG